MGELTLWTLVLTQGLVLASVGIAGAWVAGRLGTAPMVGAVLAGVLLGPSVLGAVSPGAYRALFVGGEAEARAVREYQEAAEADLETLREIDATPVEVERYEAEVERELAQMRAELAEARGPQARTLPIVAMAGIIFVMLTATRGIAGLRPWRPHMPTAICLAAGSAALAAVTAAALVALLAWLGRYEAEAMWLGGIAIGCAAVATPIPAALLDRPQGHDLKAPLLQLAVWCITLTLLGVLAVMTAEGFAGAFGYAQAAGAVVVLIILGLTAGPVVDAATERFVAVTSDGARSPVALVGFAVAVTVLIGMAIVGATLAAVALAVFVVATGLRRSRHAHASIGGFADRAGQGLFSPMLMALAGLHVNLLSDFDWLLLIVVLLAFGDGKSVGAVLAGRGSHFPWRIGLKSGAALSSGTATPVTIALLLLLTGVIDGVAYTALVLTMVISAAIALPLMRMVDQAFEEVASE